MDLKKCSKYNKSCQLSSNNFTCVYFGTKSCGWSEAGALYLIELYQNFPCLYLKTRLEYRNKGMHNKIIKNIRFLITHKIIKNKR